jgi:hypothetical protein
LVLSALRYGPKTRAELRETLQSVHGFDHEQADTMAHNAIMRLKAKGMVVRKDGAWHSGAENRFGAPPSRM